MGTPHFSFVAAAYGFAAFTLVALFIWIALDYRAQKHALETLEAQRAKKK